ncbi:MAG: phosphatase [Atopobiaceae bacterium]|nr:phosphatase [Atopobiaceae bacterium]
MHRVAVIDIGTVSVRLAIADVEDGRVRSLSKTTEICNLGEGVSSTGRISNAAIVRVLACVDEYISRARLSGAEGVCCTLTSAARDASNALQLLSELSIRGLLPQVIPGDVEGTLTFLGVAADFPGERIVVVDNGGGSTEVAVGELDGSGSGLELDWVHSYDVGCRRVTDRYLSDDDPPSEAAMELAHGFCRLGFSDVAIKVGAAGGFLDPPTRMIVCGGTATSCVSMVRNLLLYDSSKVHLGELSRAQLAKLERELSRLTLARRRRVVGLQDQRAPVIVGGIVCIAELMDCLHFDRITVSEHDLLYGLARVAGGALAGEEPLIAWTPEITAWA